MIEKPHPADDEAWARVAAVAASFDPIATRRAMEAIAAGGSADAIAIAIAPAAEARAAYRLLQERYK